VVEAYFGSTVAEEALRHADDLLAQARETERFVGSRHRQGIALEADVARSAAFRAQAEAERVAAAQRLASVRSALVLLSGDEAAGAPLATPLVADAAPAPGAGLERPDLRAARLRRDAADAGVSAARGTPHRRSARRSLDTLRTSDLEDGTTFWSLGVVARWDFLGEADRLRAARARAPRRRSLAWEERQARARWRSGAVEAMAAGLLGSGGSPPPSPPARSGSPATARGCSRSPTCSTPRRASPARAPCSSPAGSRRGSPARASRSPSPNPWKD
jgi:outer membrane protein TolC